MTTPHDPISPCPFCGGSAERKVDDNLAAFIECIECGADVGDNDGKGITRWNRRALSAPAKGAEEPVASTGESWMRGGALHRPPPPMKIVPRYSTPANEVLARADQSAHGVLVLAYDKDGAAFFDTNIDDGGAVLWLLESCKKKLLEGKHE